MAGQTLSEIRALLAARGLSPRHRYGQNFLIDLNLMRKLIAAAELSPTDVVLEVGPGTGSLTELLLESGARVVAVEIDGGLAELLRERFASAANFTLVEGDALSGKHGINRMALDAVRAGVAETGGKLKLVANLPYAAATPLLMNLVLSDLPWDRIVCTIQKEVGERITATAGSDQYGVLSVVMQTLGTPRVIAVLPGHVFWPAPDVDSVIMLITPRAPRLIGANELPAYSSVVHEAFLHRRKKLRRLVKRFGEDAEARLFAETGVNPDARPEDLSPAQWLGFFRSLQSLRA
ncbi:MAG: ribosomal RNA small subunit methyltransferase A [Phycisphaerales bacterium]|nr:ribosomal RNA small subunit methyltransferase A [Phycisphaerales bacterium]